MARPIAGATISFGLVSIPVRLYPATQSSAAISFNLLHKKDGSRLKQQYICPRDGEIVSRDEMIKGYEFAKDQYVTFTAEELKSLEEKATQSIDIDSFVPLSAIDPIYFERPYYLGPEKGGDKAYLLLAEAMRETGRAALARYAARGKQYLVMLRPSPDGRALILQELLYADEVRSMSEVPLPEGEAREAELKLAKQLIDQIASETFEPSKYHDEVRERIQADIDRKVQGQDISESAPAPEPARIIDLMAALKASLGKGAGKPEPAADTAPGEAEAQAPRRGAQRSGEAAPAEPKRAKKR
ncbi:MAG TPA: Ku protein [Polyangia bacterium]|jgi:DNA end-binding protein Ku|nr:Ku protein [Polyangia bacterium]